MAPGSVRHAERDSVRFSAKPNGTTTPTILIVTTPTQRRPGGGRLARVGGLVAEQTTPSGAGRSDDADLTLGRKGQGRR